MAVLLQHKLTGKHFSNSEIVWCLDSFHTQCAPDFLLA
ncbi:hypothetical protein D049_3969A, partial [Vibrio parahaemolyticus VPTS-2010]